MRRYAGFGRRRSGRRQRIGADEIAKQIGLPWLWSRFAGNKRLPGRIGQLRNRQVIRDSGRRRSGSSRLGRCFGFSGSSLGGKDVSVGRYPRVAFRYPGGDGRGSKRVFEPRQSRLVFRGRGTARAMSADPGGDFILPGRGGRNRERGSGRRRGEVGRERRQINPREVKSCGKTSSVSTAGNPWLLGTSSQAAGAAVPENPHSALLCWSCRAR